MDRLSTIGIRIYLTYDGTTQEIEGATEFGDLGGEPNMIDATCLTDTAQKNILGVQQQDAWNVTYLYDNTNYDAIQTMINAANTAQAAMTIKVVVPEEITSGGSTVKPKFSNTGRVSQYVQGKGVGEVRTVQLSVALDGTWTKGTETA